MGGISLFSSPRTHANGKPMKKIPELYLVYPTFLSLGLLGFLFSSVGVTLPELRSAFDLTVDQAGLVSALVQFGYAAFCFIGGVLSDLFGKKRILFLGCLLYGMCGAATGTAETFAGTLAIFAGLGVSGGLIFTSSNSLVVALSPQNRDRLLNMHHFVFAVASLASPIICSRLLLSGSPWSRVYHLLGGFSLAIGAVFAVILLAGSRLILVSSAPVQTRGAALRHYPAMFRNRAFLLLLAAGLLSVGVQFAIIYLLVLFLTQARQVPLGTASVVLSVYFVFLALGRYICAKLVQRISIYRINAILLATLTATLCLGLMTRGTVSLAIFSLTGLACSGLMPNMLSMATKTLPEGVRGAALGVFSMCGGLGGMAVTYGTTLLAARVGLERALFLLVVVSLISLVFFAFQRSASRTN